MGEPIAAFTFLTELYGEEAPGVLPLFILPSKRTLWQPPSQIRLLLQEAKPYVSTQDVYFGIGLHEKAAPEGRGDEADVIALPGLWCDLDIADPVHRVQALPPSIEAVQTLVRQACPLQPSIVIHSGHGLQAYWLFRELWTLETPTEREAAKTLCHRLQSRIQALAKEQGWHVDSTFDLARVFRLPGTYNRKAEPVPVTCLSWDPQRRYVPSDFDDLLPEIPVAFVQQTPEQSRTDGVPPLHRLQISSRLKYLLRLGEDPSDPQRYPSRSEAEFAVLMSLIDAGYGDSHIVAIMLDPLYALSAKPRERGEHWLRQEIARARSKQPARPTHKSEAFSPGGSVSADPVPLMPPLPETAQFHPELAEGAAPWLEAYCLHSQTWAPRAAQGFHQAIGLWILSTISARRICVHLGKPAYPMLFLALVAPSSLYTKTTTAHIGRKGLVDAGCQFFLTPDRITPQALIRRMTGKVGEDYGAMDELEQGVVRRDLGFAGQRGWYYEEWGSMLHQIRRSDSVMSEFHGMLKVLDDGTDDFSNETILRGLEYVHDPALALLASATPADLAPFMRPGSPWWRDGFWPRFAFITPLAHEEPSLAPQRRGLDTLPSALIASLHSWHERLGIPGYSVEGVFDRKGNATGQWKGTRAHTSPHALPLTEEVLAAYQAYNNALMGFVIARTVSEDLSGCYARYHEKALRIALLLASLAECEQIELGHWVYAQQVVESWRMMLHYLLHTAEASEPMSREQAWEERIEFLLMRAGAMTAREIQKQVFRCTSHELQRLLASMVSVGRLVAVPKGKTTLYMLPMDAPPADERAEEEKNDDVPF